MKTHATETPGDLSPKRHLRVYTLGRFQIEWIDPETGQITPFPPERLRGQNAATALGLFKALLSCPDRFATRSWLNEQFWPNSRQRSAEERLNDVVSSLRILLRPKGSTEMLVHFVYGTSGRGAGFRLDSYPQLWCDADAFEWYVKHALLLDQRGQDATACWEHAYGLAERGMYLSEQIEEDWSRPRRDYLTGLVRDCVHRWIQLLRQMGHVDEAIARLRSYWLEHPTDEDALRPLLEMLGERERFGEAEEYYAKALAMLAEEYQTPDDRTTETIEAVRASQVQRIAFSHNIVQTHAIIRNKQTAQEKSPLLIEFLSSVLLGTNHMAGFDETRRIVLKQIGGLAGFASSPLGDVLRHIAFASDTAIPEKSNDTDTEPWERLLAAQKNPSEVISSPILDKFERLICEAWELSNMNEWDAAKGVLASFLPRIITISQQRTHPKAAELASQGLRLQSIIIHHHLSLPEKVLICQQSVEHARLAQNPDTLIAAWLELAVAYKYDGQLDKWFRIMQDALFYAPQASPLLQSQA